jgi:hypothetical protein
MRALARLVPAVGPDHPRTAALLRLLGTDAAFDGRRHDAVAFHRQALAAATRAFGADHPAVATSRSSLSASVAAVGAVSPRR